MTWYEAGAKHWKAISQGTHQLMRFESINQTVASTFDHFSKQFIALQAPLDLFEYRDVRLHNELKRY